LRGHRAGPAWLLGARRLLSGTAGGSLNGSDVGGSGPHHAAISLDSSKGHIAHQVFEKMGIEGQTGRVVEDSSEGKKGRD